MKKNLILFSLLAILIVLTGCFIEEPFDKSILEETGSVKLLVTINNAKRAKVEQKKVKVTSAVFTLRDSLGGTVFTETWNHENPVSHFTIEIELNKAYFLEVVEFDEIENKSTTIEEIIIESGSNYLLNITLGGEVSVLIDDEKQGDQIDTNIIVFEDLSENILNVRQVTNPVPDTFKIVWDVYPNASSYRIYQYIEEDERELVKETHLNSFEAVLSEQRGFYIKYNNDLNYTLFVVPVVNTKEVQNDYYIKPITYKEEEIINSMFFDFFDSDTINSKYQFSYRKNKYSYKDKVLNDNSQVNIKDSSLCLAINTTDGGPALNFICDKMDKEHITISYKLYVHSDNDYPNRNHYTRIISPIGVWGIFDHRHSNKKGVYFKERKDHLSEDDPYKKISNKTFFDEWIDVSYIMNFKDGSLFVQIRKPGEKGTEVTFKKHIDYDLYRGRMMPISITNFDWYTGHSCIIDDLVIEMH